MFGRNLLISAMASLCYVAPLQAQSFTLLAHPDEATSYIMPSIAYDSVSDAFNVTFVATDYYHQMSQFGWAGDLYAGTMQETVPGEFTLSLDQCTKLNQSPIMVGNNYSSFSPQSPQLRMVNALKPQRRENSVVWSEAFSPVVHQYDFSLGAEVGAPPAMSPFVHPFTPNRYVNPTVSGHTVAYWSFGRIQPLPQPPQPSQPPYAGWALQINSPDSGGPGVVIADAAPQSGYWGTWGEYARSADIYAETESTGRVVFTKFTSNMGPYGYAPYWSQYDLAAGTYTDPQPILPVEFPNQMVSNIVMNDRYVIWSQLPNFGPISPPVGPLFVAQWNEDHYDMLGIADHSRVSQQPSLFGSYLVYVDDSGQRLLLRDLREDLGIPATPLIELSSGTLEYPAVWVDELTGEYVVLFQESHSPFDLKGITGVIPEPATGLLLSGLAAMLRVRRRPNVAA